MGSMAHLKLAEPMLKPPMPEKSSTCLKGIETWSIRPKEDAPRIAIAHEMKCRPQIVVAKVKL
jgi:hypothetical protein